MLLITSPSSSFSNFNFLFHIIQFDLWQFHGCLENCKMLILLYAYNSVQSVILLQNEPGVHFQSIKALNYLSTKVISINFTFVFPLVLPHFFLLPKLR